MNLRRQNMSDLAEFCDKWSIGELAASDTAGHDTFAPAAISAPANEGGLIGLLDVDVEMDTILVRALDLADWDDTARRTEMVYDLDALVLDNLAYACA